MCSKSSVDAGVMCATAMPAADISVDVGCGHDVPYTATGKAKRLEPMTCLAPQLSAHRDTAFRRPRTASDESR
jgi:long-chain acyl-CoA synthetase